MAQESAFRAKSPSASVANPFTQSWIQALTLAAGNPLARTIKPKLDWIDCLSRTRPAAEQVQAAEQLWEFAQQEGLLGMLEIVPVAREQWIFDQQDVFLYRRTDVDASTPSLTGSFQAWSQALGLEPAEYALTAEVTGSDWVALVRKEAVRLQHSMSMTAVQHASTMHLACTARWEGRRWKVRFDQLEWIQVPYEEAAVVPRPDLGELEETLHWQLATAADQLIVKKSASVDATVVPLPWLGCVARLHRLHDVVQQQRTEYSPWLWRVWCCVWPIVYREQNVLQGKADLQWLRQELAECLSQQPRLTLWMFVFAKLVCQTQLGMGLGVSADYRDEV